MRTVAIIQARMDSQRLPGKALMEIGDRTILEWVIRRAEQIHGVDEVVVATTTLPEDDAICALVGCYSGATDDVLDRYLNVAAQRNATHILRVTADCPLLDPGLNSRIVDTLKTTRAEYVSMSTRSNGFVQEAFTMGALRRAWEHADKPSDREHVVPWMIRNEKTRFLRSDVDLGSGRYCVDTQHDLDRLRSLWELEPCLFEMSAEQIVRLEAGVPSGAHH